MSGPPSPEDRKKAPVSGVMPVHNEMDVLQEVLDSVARQTRPVDELIIVFDRCTDGSREVALRLPHEEITVDLGNTGAAVRVGLERARYSTVVLFDGNTRVPPDYVEGLLKGTRTSSNGMEVSCFCRIARLRDLVLRRTRRSGP